MEAVSRENHIRKELLLTIGLVFSYRILYLWLYVPKCVRTWSLHLNSDSVRGEGSLIAAKRGTGPPGGQNPELEGCL